MHSFLEFTQNFEENFYKNLPFPQAPPSLYNPCNYFLKLGGKRVRPVLCLMGNELFGTIHDDAWHAARAIELFHNFSLVHDDIMDKSPLRRGKPTLHTKYGLTAGILCGDVINIYAYEQLAKITTTLSKILPLFNTTAIQVCEGQQMDMDFELRDDVSMAEYIQMITLKTSVLLACSLKMGGIIGGCLGDNANKLYEFGKNLGISFQLQDDYLDAFGQESEIGKKVGGDIIDNKKTFLYLHSIANANPTQSKQLKSLLNYNEEDKVKKMQTIFSETGADIACYNAMKHFSDLAFQCLENIAVPTKRKQQLKELAQFLLNRKK